MLKPFDFDPKVAVETILYIAQKANSPTLHKISKLLYFADRLHLQRYGRFICGDSYVAMQHGPVPSRTYDMLKSVRDGFQYISFPEVAGAFRVEGQYSVIPLRQPDLEWLSDSDIECLDESIRKYDNCGFKQLTDISHDAAWKSADQNEEISLEVIVQTIGNPHNLLQHLMNPHP